ETLEDFIKQWQGRHATIRFSLRHQLPDQLGTSINIAIYRVVQEAVINAVRHARPTAIDVAVVCSDDKVSVSVLDDGVGLPEDWSRPGHFGLRGLQERMTMLGGALTLADHQPHGVALTADIPLGARS
ncbi:sensor histidine kinase, partial [Steroidobacter sp.]|uniref:sensor histidine kinase n=1 Tax=Steroidobacter sp. TaxID=1978227 RepID=UPI001A3BF0EB